MKQHTINNPNRHSKLVSQCFTTHVCPPASPINQSPLYNFHTFILLYKHHPGSTLFSNMHINMNLPPKKERKKYNGNQPYTLHTKAYVTACKNRKTEKDTTQIPITNRHTKRCTHIQCPPSSKVKQNITCITREGTGLVNRAMGLVYAVWGSPGAVCGKANLHHNNMVAGKLAGACGIQRMFFFQLGNNREHNNMTCPPLTLCGHHPRHMLENPPWVCQKSNHRLSNIVGNPTPHSHTIFPTCRPPLWNR